MDRLLRAQNDFGPFVKGALYILDDQLADQAGWINTGYFEEIKSEEPARGDDQGTHRAG